MKTAKIIGKLFVGLAAAAGVVYVVATYGDRMVAWARKTLSRYKDCDSCNCTCEDCTCDCDCNCFNAEPEEETAPADFEG